MIILRVIKKILYTFIILLFSTDSMSAHLFTLPDGRTIEATIRSFNDHSGLVELRLY